MEKKIKTNFVVNSIEQKEFRDNDKKCGSDYIGAIINTDKGEIRLGIANYQCCCESWETSVTDNTDGNTKLPFDINLINIEDIPLDSDYDEGGKIKIEFSNNDKLFFTVVLENHHNGYYSHSLYLSIFDDLIDWESI